MKLLVSVRDLTEALAAAANGADLIDLKEPRAGALGALPLADIQVIVQVLRAQHPRLRISATVGDVHADPAALIDRVRQTAACGADDVKVGLAPSDAELLHDLGAIATAGLLGRAQIVPVLLADDGVPTALVERCSALPFAAVMLDTQKKSQGSLLDQRSASELRRFVAAVQAQGQQAGLAGSLRISDLPALITLGCDFAGFRGAVCSGDRRGSLEAIRVDTLRRGRDRWAVPAAVN
jgi:uncharacterized protein (UPF0264 family)